MTTNGSQISFGGDENVLELDRDDDYTVTESHPLKGSVVFHVNFISIESTLVSFGAGSWRAGGQKAACPHAGQCWVPHTCLCSDSLRRVHGCDVPGP